MRNTGRHPSRGFTLLETMVAVAVVAILLSLAVPMYSDSRLNSQLRASANDLVGSVYLARSEAIKRGTVVRLCASANGETCGGAWNQGWIVTVGADVLDRQAALPSGFVVSEANGIGTFAFQSTGVDSTAGTFVVCRAQPVGERERVVSIDATGRASVARTATGTCD